MFEGSLIESRSLTVSPVKRWTTLGSLTVQCAVAGLLIAIPLMKPDVLPIISVAPQVSLPYAKRPPVVPVQTNQSAAASTGISVTVASTAPAAPGPTMVLHPMGWSDGPAPAIDPSARMGMSESGPFGVLNALGGGGSNVAVVRARDPGPVHVSGGVSEGLLLTPIRPIYPAIARAAWVQGTVVMEAVISKAGRIERLRAVSGPEMLRGAALSAVQAARYRPYLLSGEPTEVQTTVTVVFTLAN